MEISLEIEQGRVKKMIFSMLFLPPHFFFFSKHVQNGIIHPKK
jgi:hypothetical protein